MLLLLPTDMVPAASAFENGLSVSPGELQAFSLRLELCYWFPLSFQLPGLSQFLSTDCHCGTA